MADFIKCCLDCIRQISDDIKDAIVYLDAGCTESFQFLGAFPLLLDLGARAVCSLEKTYLDEVVSWQPNPDCRLGRCWSFYNKIKDASVPNMLTTLILSIYAARWVDQSL